jgi:hypothetical protein
MRWRSSSLIASTALQHRGARRDVVARREHREAAQLLPRVAGQRIEQRDRFQLVVEQRDAHRALGVFRREDVDHVAAHAIHAALEVDLVALVLHFRQAADDLALADLLAGAQVQDHAVVIDRVADAVDRRHGAHDHHVAPLQQALGRAQTHLLDVLVDRRILLDEQVARRHIGLGLVVVVVGNEILDRVLGKELAEFRVQLRRQRLVRRQHQRRPAQPRDDIGHGVGLARAGDAEQSLEREAVVEALGQQADRLGLVSRRRKRLVQAPRTARELDHPALQFVNLGHRLPACLFMETPENPDETGPGIRVLLRALRCNIKSP